MKHNNTLLKIHEDVAADHYDRGIRSNLFQKYWHSRRFKEVNKIITPISGNILNIGCHSGLFTEKIIRKTSVKGVYGIDVSKSAIEKAKKRIPKGHFQVADAHKLPFTNNTFNAVFCLEVLEHVDYPDQVILEIKRVLKKGGYGVILVPTDTLLFKLIWFLWNLKYKVWFHTHVQSFTNSKLEDLITKNGLKVTKLKIFNLGMLKLVKFSKA